VELETDPDPTQAYAGPLAVLVDRFSASASEIFAGAIQDYGRGVVIGEPTFGKGTVQTLINLGRFVPEVGDPAGQLKLTVAKFYRISGGSTQHRGVVPDLAFPSTFSSDEVGESSEKYALPWDKIKPAHYQSSPYPASLISELAQLHQARLTTDPVLKQVLEDIEDTKKIRQQKTVSLLQKQRVAERDKLESRRLARENQIRSLLGLPALQKNEKKSERDQKDEPDPWLDESVRITADLTNLLNKQSRVNKFVMSVD
jgi:carboxyl-terminal processing protease